jgi:hypothetical protein
MKWKKKRFSGVDEIAEGSGGFNETAVHKI